MTTTHQRILLASRPKAEASTANFELVEAPLDEHLDEGQVLVKHHFLSLDPYMRGRMSDAKSYAAPQPLGEVMVGGTAGEVLASRDRRFAAGDLVVGMGGWQTHAKVSASTLRKVDTSRVPLSAYLGAVGMPGVTAWYGLTQIIAPKPGATVVVSAASGAVGSVVGQLAKARGCRAVGIAGGPEKCGYVRDELGFDACVDYKEHRDLQSLSRAIAEACPDGVDGLFENVGGMVMDAVMVRTSPFARVAVCGMIAGYDGQPIPMAFPQLILTNRLRVEGFIVSEHPEHWPAALKELGELVATGKLKYRETIAKGLSSAPEAFLGMLKGKNFGKQLVDLR
ncbi:NADP-dependent oxidoreductase [Sandaracinus amylolyticus]|uniref:Quinone oxidoreductase n=1 Tax=Sandaracinus amylolyticus TaxID=927083 RepID=A0A0F6W1E8_9BACT|nr:NADP-dependent oxidoreductase [Sandaracinus amylolyticus]AKF05043.1 Quinone oxidoreductase [Sandaracinus amylolyticus]